jgi:hypothetical protein
MSDLIFRSRQGQFTIDKCPVVLLKWYSQNEDPKWAKHREAAIDELSRRPAEDVPTAAVRAPSEPPTPNAATPVERKPVATAQASGTALAKQEWKLSAFVSKEAEVLNERLAKITDTCHLITPTTVFGDMPPGYAAQVTIVAVNKTEDCVNIEGNLMLSAHTLKRVSTAVGISWDMALTKRTDDNGQRIYWSFQAVGVYTDIDGEKRQLSGVYELDLRDDSARVRSIFAKEFKKATDDADEEFDKTRGGKPDSELDDYWDHLMEKSESRHKLSAEKEIDGLRKNGLTRAETGAKSRAIAELIKRSERGNNAWSKPIACVRLIKQQSAQAAMQQLYPPSDTPTVIEGEFETNEGKQDNE